MNDLELDAKRAIDALQRLQDSLSAGKELEEVVESLKQHNKLLEAKVQKLELENTMLRNGAGAHAISTSTRERQRDSSARTPRMRRTASFGKTIYDTKRSSYARNREIVLHHPKHSTLDEDDEDYEIDDEEPSIKKLLENPKNTDENALQRYSIKTRPKEFEGRSGFLLLLASDEEAEIQHFKDGRLKTTHVTKARTKLKWCMQPRLVLLIKKPNDEETTKSLLHVAKFLAKKDIQVIVEEKVIADLMARTTNNMIGVPKDKFCKQDIDFCICLGGDGTIIWTVKQFPDVVPPILAFSMGSLGFLAPFGHKSLDMIVDNVLNDVMEVTVRTRIEAVVTRKNSFGENQTKKYQVLNEVVVDRGPIGTLVNLEMYIGDDTESVTSVQADGIIIATPTGSTAYSLASGGSMVHPAIPAMVVTPICPHTLSFRPVVIADSTYVRLRVPENARVTAYASFDGKDRVELRRGEYVDCRVSPYPLTAYCAESENTDWFRAIKSSFHWNVRPLQKKN